MEKFLFQQLSGYFLHMELIKIRFGNYQGELSIIRAVVDPERKILLDIDYSNNQKMVGKEDDILRVIEEKYLEIIKAFTQYF